MEIFMTQRKELHSKVRHPSAKVMFQVKSLPKVFGIVLINIAKHSTSNWKSQTSETMDCFDSSAYFKS